MATTGTSAGSFKPAGRPVGWRYIHRRFGCRFFRCRDLETRHTGWCRINNCRMAPWRWVVGIGHNMGTNHSIIPGFRAVHIPTILVGMSPVILENTESLSETSSAMSITVNGSCDHGFDYRWLAGREKRLQLCNWQNPNYVQLVYSNWIMDSIE